MNSLFKVSAKNHAGMILMTILAQKSDLKQSNSDNGFISLKDVAGEMGLSQKFLEEIAASLKRAGLVIGRKGPGGGYKLAKPAKEISVHEILVALEGPIAPMSCDGAICPVADQCSSKVLWKVLHKELVKSLTQTKLQQIIK